VIALSLMVIAVGRRQASSLKTFGRSNNRRANRNKTFKVKNNITGFILFR